MPLIGLRLYVILVLLALLVCHIHFTHVSRFSNVGCMSEEITRSLRSGQDGSFPELFSEKGIDIYFLRVRFCTL